MRQNWSSSLGRKTRMLCSPQEDVLSIILPAFATTLLPYVVDTYSLYTTDAGANIVCSLRQDTQYSLSFPERRKTIKSRSGT
eukprot:scaffold14690_cov72-Skeletonema_dohrnii-CCMP3373.AAC.2